MKKLTAQEYFDAMEKSEKLKQELYDKIRPLRAQIEALEQKERFIQNKAYEQLIFRLKLSDFIETFTKLELEDGNKLLDVSKIRCNIRIASILDPDVRRARSEETIKKAILKHCKNGSMDFEFVGFYHRTEINNVPINFNQKLVDGSLLIDNIKVSNGNYQTSIEFTGDPNNLILNVNPNNECFKYKNIKKAIVVASEKLLSEQKEAQRRSAHEKK